VLGNHEYGTNQGQPFLDGFHLPTNNPQRSERYYSFDWGHVHFVALDSTCAVGAASKDRCDRDAMKAWAKADLEQSDAPWKIVFFHHPLWSSGKHGSTLNMREAYAPIFESTGVDLVLTGHDHDYERSKPMMGDSEAANGISYLVVGSGGAHHRSFTGSKPAWSAVRDDVNFGYLDVKVTGGSLTARMVTPSNKVIDSFTLTKALPPEPSLDVAAASERGPAPFTAKLSATTTGLDGATVRWAFGDGTSGEGAQVSHVFDKPGTYQAVATVSGSGTTLTEQLTLNVDAPAATGGGGTQPSGGGTQPSAGGTTPSTTPAGEGTASGGTPATTPATTPSSTGTPPVVASGGSSGGSRAAAGASGSSGRGCQSTPGAALLPFGLGLSALLLRRRARTR
jgi:uncharacterized protein (TIGR03382 family)